jgi:hypothetical protein
MRSERSAGDRDPVQSFAAVALAFCLSAAGLRPCMLSARLIVAMPRASTRLMSE